MSGCWPNIGPDPKAEVRFPTASGPRIPLRGASPESLCVAHPESDSRVYFSVSGFNAFGELRFQLALPHRYLAGVKALSAQDFANGGSRIPVGIDLLKDTQFVLRLELSPSGLRIDLFGFSFGFLDQERPRLS